MTQKSGQAREKQVVCWRKNVRELLAESRRSQERAAYENFVPIPSPTLHWYGLKQNLESMFYKFWFSFVSLGTFAPKMFPPTDFF